MSLNPARFGLYILFLILLFSFPSSAKIYFHCDFEQGETYLQQSMEPGAKTIRLISNHRLEEWPLAGGEGIIEGNLPSKMEGFFYKTRKGNVLKGVSSIQYFHDQGVGVRTGNLLEWQGGLSFASGRIGITKSPILFGNYCAELNCSSDSVCVINKEAHESQGPVYCQFYIVFSQEILGHPVIWFPFFTSSFMPSINLAKANEKDRAYLALTYDSAEMKKNMPAHEPEALAPDKKYFIEYCLTPKDSDHSVIALHINGKMQEEYQLHRKRGNGAKIIFGNLMGKRFSGRIYIDNLSLADSSLGSMPEMPRVRFVGNQLVSSIFKNADARCFHNASQWMIHDKNAWINPNFNTGEDKRNLDSLDPYVIRLDTVGDQRESYHCKIPTGILSGKSYYARVRHRANNGWWSEWSAPLFFKTPAVVRKDADLLSGLPELRDFVFTEVGKTKPVVQIQKGKWYDFYVYMRDAKGASALNFADVWMVADPEENALGNYENRGGVYKKVANEIITFSLSERSTIYIKAKENSPEWTFISGKPGFYVDDDSVRCFFDTSRNWVRARVRLLQDLKSGPLVVRGFVANKESKPSRIYSKLFTIASPETTGKISIIDYSVIVLSIVIFLFAIFIFYQYEQNRKLRRKTIPQTRQGPKEIPDEMIDLPVPGDSPHSEKIKKVQEFIFTNLGDPLSRADIAKALNVSPVYLSNFFSKETGKTLSHYINEVKVNRAKKLLKETNLNITEIAFGLGYGSLFHFSYVFRQIEKISPKKYRARLKKP